MAHKVLSSLQLSGPIEVFFHSIFFYLFLLLFSSFLINKFKFKLQINSLGDIESRKNYRKTLQNYFEEKKSMLSETSKLRYSLKNHFDFP